MNHDIFISYSHKNITAAQAICHELEDKGIKCWMAPRDIPVGAKYASVISKAIVHSRIVVLVFSDYSARSPWVESEINIAFSNRKTIIPYKIDKTNYEEFDEFYLMLNNRHWIEAYPDYKTRFKELVTIVAQTLGRTISANKPTMSTPTPAPAPMPTPTPTQKQSSETLMPTSKPNNLKRYWWVALCVLVVCVVYFGGYIIAYFKYDLASDSFSEGLAAVKLNGKYGYIDKTGKEVTPLKYDDAWSFSEGLAVVKLNGKCGFIDKTGKEVTPLKYDAARSFSEGLAAVELNGKYDGKWGYVDKTGKEVTPFKYDYVDPFSEGLAAVGLINGKFGFIDKTGKEVIPLKYDYAYSFNGGLAKVELNGEEFYIDKNGNRVK